MSEGLKTHEFTIETGRDAGATFAIREMPAVPAADWFLRAIQVLGRSGMDVPPDLFRSGVEGFLALGMGALLAGVAKSPYGEIKPLLNELLACIVSFRRADMVQPLMRWQEIETQIIEPGTIFRIYEEVLSLHLGFSIAARLLNFRTLVASMITAFTPNTATSTNTSEMSAGPDSPRSMN